MICIPSTRAYLSLWTSTTVLSGTKTWASIASSSRVYRRNKSTSAAPRIGFIGLGRMGYPMAVNLLKKAPTASSLTVFDVNKDAIAAFSEEPTNSRVVNIAAGPAEVAKKSDLIFTMLPENSHVKSVYQSILNDNEITKGEQKLFVDCSTIDPFVSTGIAKELRAAHPAWEFLDAPVSGGVVGATAGTLTFMLGADEGMAQRVEPTLMFMGRRLFQCGPPGAGLIAKLANNYLLAVSNIATCEAMNFGIKLGLSPTVLGNVINSSTGKCWSSEVNNPVLGVVKGAPAERDYQGGFGVRLMRKDLKLATAAGKQANIAFGLAEAAEQVYDTTSEDPDKGSKDFSVVYKTFSEKS